MKEKSFKVPVWIRPLIALKRDYFTYTPVDSAGMVTRIRCKSLLGRVYPISSKIMTFHTAEDEHQTARRRWASR